MAEFCKVCYASPLVKEFDPIFSENEVCSAECNRFLLRNVGERVGQTRLTELKWISK